MSSNQSYKSQAPAGVEPLLTPRVSRLKFALTESALTVRQVLVDTKDVTQTGLQQIDDFYFDSPNHLLFKQGFACCLRETQGGSVLCLLPIDGLGCGKDEQHDHYSQVLSDKRVSGPVDPTTLGAGTVTSLLNRLVGQGALQQRYRVKVIRRYYQLRAAADQTVELDEVSVYRAHSSCKKNRVELYTQLSLMSSIEDAAGLRRLYEDLSKQFVLAPCNINALRRAMHDSGELLSLYRSRQNTKPLKTIDDGRELFCYVLDKPLQHIRYWKDFALAGDKKALLKIQSSVEIIIAVLRLFKKTLHKGDYRYWKEALCSLENKFKKASDLHLMHEWLQQKKSIANNVDKEKLVLYEKDIVALTHQTQSVLVASLQNEANSLLFVEMQAWLKRPGIFNAKYLNCSVETLKKKGIKKAIKKSSRYIKALKKNNKLSADKAFSVVCNYLALRSFAFSSTKDTKLLKKMTKKTKNLLNNEHCHADITSRIESYAKSRLANSHGQEFIFYLGQLHNAQLRESEYHVDQRRRQVPLLLARLNTLLRNR
jgi:inorganic triphosphatase YgiF